MPPKDKERDYLVEKIKKTPKLNKLDEYLIIEKVVEYMTIWAKVIENEKNIEEWVKPWYPLKLQQAVREFWMPSPSYFYSKLKKYPALKERYDEMKESARSYMQSLAEDHIYAALDNQYKSLTEKDKVDISFRLNEKTHKAYNPKSEVELAIEKIPERSSNEILSELSELIWKFK